MKPQILSNKNWKRLTKRFKTLDLKNWNNLDGLKKANLLRISKIKFNSTPIFGQDFNLTYPDDIYLSDICALIKLDNSTLNTIRRKALYEEEEKGGTIDYDQEKIQIDFKFTGDKTRISLDFKGETHTLFHTHVKDDDRLFDPPSVLDILSYLVLIVKNIADMIIIDEIIDNPLIIQNAMVFSHNEVYVYYISYPLIEKITHKLMDIYTNSEDFVKAVEYLLEEIELAYSEYLFLFNRDLNEEDLDNYLKTLSKLGIIIKRFKYTEAPEVYAI